MCDMIYHKLTAGKYDTNELSLPWMLTINQTRTSLLCAPLQQNFRFKGSDLIIGAMPPPTG